MILTIFLSLLGLAAFLVVLGYFTDDDIYTPIGLAIIFLAAVAILTDGVEYVSGAVEVSEYHYFNDTNPATDNFMINSTTTITDSYATWNDATSHIVGWVLAVVSFAGFILSLLMMRYRRVEEV